MYSGLFTQAELDRAEQDGLVRISVHPEDPELWIANYTQETAFDGRWDNVTLNCRGLIFDAFGDIVARPFPKFFNYGQPGCPEIDLDEPAVVSDKMDGSLGILYRFDGPDYRIATRGSFISDQAVHATELLKTKYVNFKPLRDWTYLFEIVYPENRIVCDYGDRDELVFLGAVHKNDHSYDSDVAKQLGWYGPVAEVLPYASMREALKANPRAGKEGVVVHLLDSDVRVKLKQEDYVRLHKIVTGLNARSVWEAMLNDTVDELIEQVPDEFHDFVRGVEQDIESNVYESLKIVNIAFRRISREMLAAGEASKRDFAMRAKDHNYAWALFKLWDDVSKVDIYSELLRRAKPKHDYSPVKVSDDAD